MLDVSNDDVAVRLNFDILQFSSWQKVIKFTWTHLENSFRFTFLSPRALFRQLALQKPLSWHSLWSVCYKIDSLRSQYETPSKMTHLHSHPVDSCQFGGILFKLTMFLSKSYGNSFDEWMIDFFHTFSQEFRWTNLRHANSENDTFSRRRSK